MNTIEESIDGDYEVEYFTPIEIIDETVKYYSEDLNRRAYVPGNGCQYLTEDGRMCAVGRCLENVEEVAKYFNLGHTVDDIHESYLDFKPQYQGLNKTFWNDLQSLHDPDRYWNSKYGGLTQAGQEWVNSMKEMAAAGHYYPD